MICATSDVNALLVSAIPRSDTNKVALCKPAEIFDYMKIDPEVRNPRIDALVVSSRDVNKRNVVKQFQEALNDKHPDAKVIYICKDRKPDNFANDNRIDTYLVKPRSQQVADAIYQLSAKLSEKPVITSSTTEAQKLQPKEAKVDLKSIMHEGLPTDGEEETEGEEVELEFTDDDLPVEKDVQHETVVDNNTAKEPELVTRMRNASSVADIAVLMRETTAEQLLKDIAHENATFAVIENKLAALKDEINEIMIDGRLPMEERLSKIRSLIYSKKYFALQSNTLIEQYVTQIIEAFTSNTVRLLNDRLKEIDESIKLSTRYGTGTQNFGRLTGINEERASTIMELNTLKYEVQEIGVRAADIIHETTAEVAAKNQELTGNELLDNNIKAHGTFIVDGDSIEILRSILTMADSSTEQFKEAVHCVTAMLESYNKLMQLDKEQIAATNEMVKYMQAHSVEDTVVANTLLKKSLRVFTGAEGVGRTIIPYMLSKRKSKENANVLLVDLTGTSKLDDYGIDAYTLDEYRANRYEKDFVVVKGTCTSIESAQNLTAILTRAADFYRVINVVLPMDNKDVFDVLAHDVLCINYLTNTKKRNMKEIKDFMADTQYENVAKRLIVNDSSLSLNDLATYFNLLDRLDCQLLSLPHISQVEICSLNSIDPLTIDFVNEQLVEVSKYA